MTFDAQVETHKPASIALILMKHHRSLFPALRAKDTPFRTRTALHACICVHHDDIISMSHQIGPPELLHEPNIMTTALAAAAERIHMRLRVVDGQVDQPPYSFTSFSASTASCRDASGSF